MPIWSNIRDLKPRNFGWNMRLRLVRAYDVLDFAGRDIKSLEYIFQDKTGDMIYAQIKKPWVSKHKPILHEGKLYRMSKFLVALNDMLYPTTDAPFMINTCGSTLIYEDLKEEFPNLRFVLKRFADFETNTNIITRKLYVNSHKSEIALDEEVSTPKKDKGKEKPDEGIDSKTIKRKLYDEISATRPRRKAKGIVIKEEKKGSP
ncbi:hypothetical protein OROHE_009614 [Orobanche hederae]